MSKDIKAIRGMHDMLPDQAPLWRLLEGAVRQILDGYGYQEIRTPVVEMSELFARSIGDVTDIVEKEMYSFTDRNGDSLSLRPEGTASCVRAVLEHGLLHTGSQRLWYMGPMFRHERPQRGRYRQFHQIGLEVFGLEGPDIDLETILISHRIWRTLGIGNLELQINTLGDPAERLVYREQLVRWLMQRKGELDEDSLRRLDTNPLRILDSKNPAMAELIAEAPGMEDSLSDASRQHFTQLCQGLDAHGLDYRINRRLVRGLDYYNRTVYEWVSNDLGAQGTVCAGGRYDGLVAQLGGKPTPAVGLALGCERILALLQDQGNPGLDLRPDAYLVLVGEAAIQEGMLWAEQLRNRLPWLKLLTNGGGGSFKSQLKRADKSGARFAIIMGENEVSTQAIGLKALREEREQQSLNLDQLTQFLIESRS
jgi:histidyl-tRNA synthetase